MHEKLIIYNRPIVPAASVLVQQMTLMQRSLKATSMHSRSSAVRPKGQKAKEINEVFFYYSKAKQQK
jgi:hypothetical protein